MLKKSGFETSSGISIACSTLSPMLLMTCNGSGGCLAPPAQQESPGIHVWEPRTQEREQGRR